MIGNIPNISKDRRTIKKEETNKKSNDVIYDRKGKSLSHIYERKLMTASKEDAGHNNWSIWKPYQYWTESVSCWYYSHFYMLPI